MHPPLGALQILGFFFFFFFFFFLYWDHLPRLCRIVETSFCSFRAEAPYVYKKIQ
jgi:hypothetical protein